jgi:hypothetical protein
MNQDSRGADAGHRQAFREIVIVVWTLVIVMARNLASACGDGMGGSWEVPE